MPAAKINPLSNLSVIIPLASGERKWKALLKSLEKLPEETEILFISPDKLEGSDQETFFEFQRKRKKIDSEVRWELSTGKRAQQLNVGAGLASKEFLWFLHADSSFKKKAIKALASALTKKPEALHFFQLGFSDDGPSQLQMGINEFGTWFRSRFFRMPFGDQGFCFSKEIFEKVGPFCEETPYGEDHLLIWKAHQRGVSIREINEKIFTSARKYTRDGWWPTTRQHLKSTYSQAYPEFKQMLKTRVLKNVATLTTRWTK